MTQLCPKCQTENVLTAKFCKKCGTALTNATGSQKSMPSKELSDIEKRVLEEKLYEQVALDIKNGKKREGLYMKALVDANGSKEMADIIYIKYAVQALKDEQTLQVKTVETKTTIQEPIISTPKPKPVEETSVGLSKAIENPTSDIDKRINEIQQGLNQYNKNATVASGTETTPEHEVKYRTLPMVGFALLISFLLIFIASKI
jgi:hypothetical protein